MLPALHLLLVEPDLRRAQRLMCMLSSLGIVTTRAADPAQAAALLAQMLPDGLLVGVQPLGARELRAWLADLLAADPPWTLLYAEQAALLDDMRADLPPLAAARWPCSADELGRALAPLTSVGTR